MASLLLDHTILKVLLSLFVAFLITYLFIPYIVDAARAKHLFDKPNGRTSHHIDTPRLGGMAIFAGFIISGMIFINIMRMGYIQYVIAGSIIIFFLGLKDDLLSMSPMQKLLGQIASASIIIVLGDVLFTNLHGFFGIFELGYTARVFFSLFVIILVINSFNLIDGIDGLAASVGLLVVGFFTVWFFLVGQIDLAVFSAALVGALIAFLRYNVFSIKNKIFMGDIGSLTLGFFISVLIIRFNEVNLSLQSPYAIKASPSVTFGILILPLFDTLRVFVIRIIKGQSPFSADKMHLHHGLLALGMSHRKATGTLVLVNVLFIAFVVLLQNIGMHTLFLVTFILAAILSNIPSIIIYRKNRLSHKTPTKTEIKK
jgi:UDP-N-acetylmuramyl pentapeptide phosphotransferase/UDP-N-acetylglucosamine-1-phosphate transferase